MATLDEQMARMAEVAALERLAGQGAEAVPELLARVADADPVSSATALRLLFGLAPVAALPARFAEGELLPHATEGAAANLPEWLTENPWNDPEKFCRLCIATAGRLEAESRLRFAERLAPLAGVRDDLAASFARAGWAAEANALDQAAAELTRRQYPAQITFAPTMRCNLRCPYCIAGTDGDEAEASPENVAALLDWMARHGVRRLGLTGGEPTLYRRFPALLAELRGRGIEYYLATNGLMPEAALEAITITKDPPLCLTLHLTQEVTAGPHADAFRAAARRLTEAHVPVILRCNFAEPDADITPYLDFAQEHGIRELRIAIPMPNSGRGNAFVDAARLAAFAPLLARLCAGAGARAVQVQLAKPYPLCLMPEAAARHFLENGSLACACPNYALGFSNNLIVYPDLRFAACLGLNRRSSEPITQYDGPRDAARLFAPDIARRMRAALLPECAACPLGRRGQCIGACLSYR